VSEPFETFDLAILFAGKDNAIPEIWMSAFSQLGSIQAYPREKPEAFAVDDMVAMGREFRAAIRTGAFADLGRWGDRLRDLVFGVHDIGSLFRRTRGAAAAAGRPLLLRIMAVPEWLAALPWELMTDPDGDEPLVFASDVHVARNARDRHYQLRDQPIAPPLHVLVVLSNPTGTGGGADEDMPFDHYEEGRALMRQLQPLVEQGLLLVDIEDRPSIERLRRRIGARRRGYHIVHYLGHAEPGRLKLENSEGFPHWVDSEEFNAVLRTCPDLRVTFFAGCSTASLPDVENEGEHFVSRLSVADRSVREACQTVIGMQAVLPLQAERVLTQFFYQSLCAGASVARALSLARHALRDLDGPDGSPAEHWDRSLMTWAVPSLVTSHLPGPILDPGAAVGSPPTLPRQARLMLDLHEPDREFFARFVPLRRTLDVLLRHSRRRIVWVTGPAGAGKTRLISRALHELDGRAVEAVLYLPARRLLSEPAASGDPVRELCVLVTELTGAGSDTARAVREDWSGLDWWDRVVEELVDRSFVLALDDVDEVSDAVSEALGLAIDRLVRRVSLARVVLGSAARREGFLTPASETYVANVYVPHLKPAEIRDWLLRNRPALAHAIAAEPAMLATIHNVLGSRLHLWSDLAEAFQRQAVPNLGRALEEVRAAEEAFRPAGSAASAPAQEPQGPLRVAIAGPHTDGRAEGFADAVSALAIHHGASLRVVAPGGADASTASAVLLPIPTPFDDGRTSPGKVHRWLDAAAEDRADVVVLDYGAPAPDEESEARLRTLADRALVVAAGGIDAPYWPAEHPFVLGVGALGSDGSPADYSTYNPGSDKPDLYAPESLQGTGLETILRDAEARGPSMAAMFVAGASILVWSLDRGMTHGEVRQILLDTAVPVGGQGARRLDLPAALTRARLRLLRRGLVNGPLSQRSAAAAAGVDLPDVLPLLQELSAEGVVVRQPESGLFVPDAERLQQSMA
jgi:hypothetical protein